MKLLKKMFIVLLCVAVLLIAVFLIGRYGWKLGGFNACETAGIEQVNVEEDHVRIRGFYPGSFPTGFLGYHAEQEDDTLYVGFRFSSVFGFFETGDFDITIPIKGDVSEVILKTSTNESTIWSKDDVLEDSNDSDRVPDPREQPTILEAYATVIGEYYAALSEGYDAAQMMELGLNYMTADRFFAEPLEDIGYVVTDLDEDGMEELVIGSLKDDEFYGKLIFSLYTLDEKGVPQLLFDSTERNRYYYAGSFCFANLGSSGWNSSFVTTLKLEGHEMIDMTYTTDPADYVQMELTPLAQWTE